MTSLPPRRDAPECFVSVDIETAGPVPAEFSMLSIGACLVDDPDTTFYVELRPELTNATPEALQVTGLSLEHLLSRGVPAKAAMTSFANWVAEAVPAGHRPVFTAFNAAFDWMFICDYFQRHLGRNPFGYAALDIKAFAMGSGNTSWAATSMDVLAARHLGGRQLTHNALADAQDQAELFRSLLKERESLNAEPTRSSP
ncbi:3'-5' exoribonuclease domain-containing protein [Nocardioides sp.]|uniref:3'-5' exonuclease n=1 Tax=Nocardioides sp. TaxID=35761 RepID=UPI003564F987